MCLIYKEILFHSCDYLHFWQPSKTPFSCHLPLSVDANIPSSVFHCFHLSDSNSIVVAQKSVRCGRDGWSKNNKTLKRPVISVLTLLYYCSTCVEMCCLLVTKRLSGVNPCKWCTFDLNRNILARAGLFWADNWILILGELSLITTSLQKHPIWGCQKFLY